jgi:N-acetylglutamate synthase-like GNAT family acetyltransferase
MYTFRYATAEDIPLIRELCYQVWPQTYASMLTQGQIDYMLEMMYSEASLARQFEEGVQYIIMLDAGMPVGFAALAGKDDGRCKLEKLYVLPSKQGKGAGRRFMDHIVSAATGGGASALYLQVKKNNPARHFYAKTGFSIIDDIVLDIGNGFVMDDYIMQRELRG